MTENVLLAPTGQAFKFNDDGSVTGSWASVDGAKSYLIHYADANEADPKKAIYMGYTEDTSWTLAADDVPKHTDADGLRFYVQSFGVTGVGSDDVTKAAYLNGSTTIEGSAWSVVFVLDKLETPTDENTVDQIISWLDMKAIDHEGVTDKDELLKLTIPVVHVTGVTLDQTSVNANSGDVITLIQTVTPSNATDQTGKWSVDNNFANVSGGKVTIKDGVYGEFDATFTTTDGGFVATTHFVIPEPEPEYPSYTVQAGDDIARVATEHGVSVGWLKYINHISGLTLPVGRVIYFDEVEG